MLQANRSESHKIKETEKDFYHVLIIRKEYDPDSNDMITNKSISIFDRKGFKQFKDFRPAGISGIEILHDPNFKQKQVSKQK